MDLKCIEILTNNIKQLNFELKLIVMGKNAAILEILLTCRRLNLIVLYTIIRQYCVTSGISFHT